MGPAANNAGAITVMISKMHSKERKGRKEREAIESTL